jgi:hypothetical protein
MDDLPELFLPKISVSGASGISPLSLKHLKFTSFIVVNAMICSL